MRKLLIFAIGLIIVLIGIIMLVTGGRSKLGVGPDSVDTAKEIAIVYDQNLAQRFNKLTPQERVFIYYMFRASLPGNSIAADQSHRDGIAMKKLFEYLFAHKDDPRVRDINPFDAQRFLDEARIYLTYLWTNHGQYFSRESAQEKRTPARIGLTLLTKDNLITVLEHLEYPNARAVVESIAPSIFDREVESTMTVPNDISKSAVNFYSPDFTNQDFDALPADAQTALNAYFYVEQQNGKRIPKYEKYSVDGKYAKELRVAVHWLKKQTKNSGFFLRRKN